MVGSDNSPLTTPPSSPPSSSTLDDGILSDADSGEKLDGTFPTPSPSDSSATTPNLFEDHPRRSARVSMSEREHGQTINYFPTPEPFAWGESGEFVPPTPTKRKRARQCRDPWASPPRTARTFEPYTFSRLAAFVREEDLRSSARAHQLQSDKLILEDKASKLQSDKDRLEETAKERERQLADLQADLKQIKDFCSSSLHVKSATRDQASQTEGTTCHECVIRGTIESLEARVNQLERSAGRTNNKLGRAK